jgi:hypothetical protein
MKQPDVPPFPPQTPSELVDSATNAIRARLPDEWRVDALPMPDAPDRGVDAVIRVAAPNGEANTVLVQAKSTFEARDVPLLERHARDRLGEPPDLPAAFLVAARYLSARVRERLAAGEIAYADATGSLYLKLRKPALFLRDVGAARDPWRGPGRPRESFKGPIAARVVRALADFAPPMTVPELIERSEVSTGGGYRVVDFLEREDLLERKPRGPIVRVDWRPILERWSRDYELDLEGSALRMLEPRGVAAVLRELRTVDGPGRYVLTGSAAAAAYEEYAQARSIMVYSDSPPELADRLELRPVETGANVLLLRPSDDVVFARASEREGLRIAAPSQIAADLLNGPGRAPAEAEALLEWMESNESNWRL